MSRNIKPKDSSPFSMEERILRDTSQGKLLLTVYRDKTCILLLRDGRLTAASFLAPVDNRIGAIYIGKVKNVVKNINACFIEIAEKEICFLPLSKASAPCLLNRKYDGRILEGDELLVQMEQEAQKKKQATVTAHISINNDYFVLSFGNTMLHFSKKLSQEKKQNISGILSKEGLIQDGCLNQDIYMIQHGFLSTGNCLWQNGDHDLPQNGNGNFAVSMPSLGAVVRTKAEDLEPEILLQSFFSLYAELCRLVHTAQSRSCFSCLKKAPGNIETVLDTLAPYLTDAQCQEIITDQPPLFHWLEKYCAEHMPGRQIRLYQDDRLSLKTVYSLDTRLNVALSSHVWLKSGAYLVIEPTEAMTVIDVNSGKCDCNKKTADTETTCFKINIEAAEEIAIQLRLRNLSGIILVDFINMTTERHQIQLLEYLRSLVKADRIKTSIIDMTPLGLVEITRKKVYKPLHEQLGYLKGQKYLQN